MSVPAFPPVAYCYYLICKKGQWNVGNVVFLYRRKTEAGTLRSSILLPVFLMSISEVLGKSWQMTMDTSDVQVPENFKFHSSLNLAFMYLLTISHISFSDTLVAASFSQIMPEVGGGRQKKQKTNFIGVLLPQGALSSFQIHFPGCFYLAFLVP